MLDTMRLQLQFLADGTPICEEQVELPYAERDPNSIRRGSCLFPDPCDVEQEWEDLSE